MEAHTPGTVAEMEQPTPLPELSIDACEYASQVRSDTTTNNQLVIKRAQDGSRAVFNIVSETGYDGNLGWSAEEQKNRTTLHKAIQIIARTDRLYASNDEQHSTRPPLQNTYPDTFPEAPKIEGEQSEELFTIHALRGVARSERKSELAKAIEDLGGVEELNKLAQEDDNYAIELYFDDDKSTVVQLTGIQLREATDPVTGAKEMRPVVILQDRFDKEGYQPPSTLVTNFVSKQDEE